jgi:drug/metabolite transporter (DMT)-like permease
MSRFENLCQRPGFATTGGFVAIGLWSTTVALVRSLSEGLGPVTSGAVVFGVTGGLALLNLALRPRRRRGLRHLSRRYVWGCGALFVTYMFCLFIALGVSHNRQQVLEVGLINYLWPILTLLLALAILGKRARWPLAPGTALALAGVFFVLTQQATVSWASLARNVAGNPLAYGLGLAAALSWAIYSNLTRKWGEGAAGGAVDLFCPATAIMLTLLCLALDEPRQWSARAAVEAAFLGMATFVAYSLWDGAMRRGNVVLVAAASYLTPLLSTIVSCLYLSVVPGAKLWVGCVLLIAGAFLSWRSIDQSAAGTS